MDEQMFLASMNELRDYAHLLAQELDVPQDYCYDLLAGIYEQEEPACFGDLQE